ncbi:MAG: F0F1 ATP synthase subunit B' [Hyphomicrobiales bacterium]
MPQLDISAWPPQLIWLAITFIALYIIVVRQAIPRVGGVIQQRRNVIEGDLGAAQRLRNATEQAVARYEKELAEARARAHAIAQENRDRLTAETDRERAKVDQELNAKIAAAEKEVARTRDQALASAQELATEIAADIVNELTGITVTKADAERALARAARAKV